MFPQALAGFLGGSVLTQRRTPTSDLDIVVVLPGPPAPYRETRTAGGWVIELFVHTPTSLLHYWDLDAEARRTPLLRMCAEGKVLSEGADEAQRIQRQARRRLAQGPAAPSAVELDRRRYVLTDLLEDVRGCEHHVELAYIASGLMLAASELVLLVHNRWTAEGKWLPRRMEEVDPLDEGPGLAERLVAGLHDVVAQHDKTALERVTLEVLALAGGPLLAGYRADGVDPAALRSPAGPRSRS